MLKKIILSTALLLLVGLVLFVYNEFNGNPISEYRAEKALQTFLATNYPENEYRVNDGSYDFKFNEYFFMVNEIGTGTVVAEEVGAESKTPPIENYHFTVRGFVFPKVNFDGIRSSRLDQPLMMRLGKEASNEIFKELQQHIGTIHHVEVTLEVLKGQFEGRVDWERTLPLDRPYQIFIVLNASEMNADDVYQTAKAIQKLLNELNYQYGSVNINANMIDSTSISKDHNGYVKYALGFRKDDIIKRNDVEEF